MKKLSILLFLILSSSLTFASYEEVEKLAPTVKEAQTLVKMKAYLYKIRDQRRAGKKIHKQSALRKASYVEQIGINGCDCPTLYHENIVRSQAYTMAAAVWGVLAKDTNDKFLGLKTYKALEKARAIDPNNLDALKGQAIALNQILAKGGFIRAAISLAIGVNLKEAGKELVNILRDYPEREDLQKLAIQLDKKL